MQALVGKVDFELSDLKTLLPVESIKLGQKSFTGNISPVTVGTRVGTGFVLIESLNSAPLTLSSPVNVKMLFIDNEPLRYRPAL